MLNLKRAMVDGKNPVGNIKVKEEFTYFNGQTYLYNEK